MPDGGTGTTRANCQRASYVTTCGCVVALTWEPDADGIHHWETLRACRKHKAKVVERGN